MTTIGGRPKGPQSFMSQVKGAFSRGKKPSAQGAMGERASSQHSFSSDGYSTDKDKDNPYLTLLPKLPQGGSVDATAPRRAPPPAENALRGQRPSPPPGEGAGLSRSNALRGSAGGVSLRSRGRGRATSEASLGSVASSSRQPSTPPSAHGFNAQLLNRVSPLEELMRETSAAAASAKAQREPAGPAAKQAEPTAVDADLWAHLG